MIPGGILVGNFQYIIMAKTRRKAEAAQETRRPHANIVPLREEYAALARVVRGDVGGLPFALVLNQVEYWQGHKDRDGFTAEERERAGNSGQGPTDCGWFYKAAHEMADEMFGLVSEKTAERALDRMVKIGVLMRRANPRNKADRTWHYRLDLIELHRQLAGLGSLADRWKELPFLECPATGGGTPAPDAIRGSDPQDAAVLAADPTAVSIRQNDGCIRQIVGCIRQNDGSIRHCDGTIPEITTRDYIQRALPKKIPLNPPVAGGTSNISFKIPDRSDDTSRDARSAALRLLGGSQGCRIINAGNGVDFPVADDPTDDPTDPDTADYLTNDLADPDTADDLTDNPTDDPADPDPSIIPFPTPTLPAVDTDEPQAAELIARILSLPADLVSDFARTHARRIEELSRQALPAGGGRRHTESWIPRAPVHALFARLGRFPGARPSAPVSRSFMRAFRDKQITTAGLVILAGDPGAFSRPELAGASDLTRWIGLLHHGSPDDEGQWTLGQELALARRQVASRCLTLDPDLFGARLAEAGVKVGAVLAGIREGHVCCVRLHWQEKMKDLLDADVIPEFEEDMMLGDMLVPTLLMKNCAIECAHRVSEDVARGLGEQPEARPVLTIRDPGHRACVIRELAKDYNLRLDVRCLLKDDVFGISRDEIEAEVCVLREEARRDLELYFDPALGIDPVADEHWEAEGVPDTRNDPYSYSGAPEGLLAA